MLDWSSGHNLAIGSMFTPRLFSLRCCVLGLGLGEMFDGTQETSG